MKLNEHFNLQAFADWTEGFLPDFSADVRKVDIPNAFTGVQSISTLGESPLGVRVFVVETDKDPSGRKVGLAKESFNLIKHYGTPNALIVYYSKDSSQWRLSLLTSTPVWSEGKILTKLSNPKRQSYVLGPSAKINTPARFLLKKSSVADINDLKTRFSLEVVNKEFYQEISENFIKLVGGTLGTGRSKKQYEPILKLPSIGEHSQTSMEFAVRLIGRIIFCWFLREKKSDDEISLMPKELLSLDAITEHSDYYHKILEPIFFEVLNQQVRSRKDPFYEKPYSLVPYLNGGLFSPHDDDFYKRKNGDLESQFHDTLIIPDDWFIELFRTLETYNFTIDENTSFDEELSIDPEMLGRIFENLLAEINPETGETARKSTGSYYTPRVIVDYMVDESLVLYLKQQTRLDESKLRAVTSYDLTDDTQYTLSEAERQEIIDAIGKIRILDPACGSGAFPIGTLQKIVFILQQIDPNGKLWFKKQLINTSPELRRKLEKEHEQENYDYIRKLGVIRESIYGIDIQPIATEISRLRCFLTLIVDQRVNDNEENRGIEPLPNLDFKFITANSLIGLPKSEGLFAQYEDIAGIEQLKTIRKEYFNALGVERAELVSDFYKTQKEIGLQLEQNGGQGYAEMSNALRKWDPFSHKLTGWFDPEWMFGVREGFDVVIANPPYISYGLRGMQKMTPEERKVLVTLFPNSAEYKISIYAIFMDKAIQLSKNEDGIQTYIVPDSFLLGRYFSKVRAQILNNCEIVHLSWMPYKIFEATVGYSIVYTFQKKVAVDPNHEVITRFIKSNNEISDKTYKEYMYPQSYFRAQKHSRFRMFFDKITMDLVGKVETDSVPLGEYFTGRTGVRSLIGQKNIISKENSGKTWQKGLTSGSQVSKYKIVYEGDYINIDPKLLNKGGWDYDVIHNPKLLVRQTGDSLIAALDINGYYHLNNIHSFAPKKTNAGIRLEYVLALINSRLLTWFYQTTSLEVGRTMAQTDIETLECLPIKKIDSIEQQKLIELVNKIMARTSNDNYLDDLKNQDELRELEQQTNQMVYELYGLTEDEIKIVEGGRNV